jgi:hypothetical protein
MPEMNQDRSTQILRLRNRRFVLPRWHAHFATPNVAHTSARGMANGQTDAQLPMRIKPIKNFTNHHLGGSFRIPCLFGLQIRQT